MDILAFIGHPFVLIGFPLAAIVAFRRIPADDGIGVAEILQAGFGPFVTAGAPARQHAIPEPDFEPFRFGQTSRAPAGAEKVVGVASEELAPAA